MPTTSNHYLTADVSPFYGITRLAPRMCITLASQVSCQVSVRSHATRTRDAENEECSFDLNTHAPMAPEESYTVRVKRFGGRTVKDYCPMSCGVCARAPKLGSINAYVKYERYSDFDYLLAEDETTKSGM